MKPPRQPPAQITLTQWDQRCIAGAATVEPLAPGGERDGNLGGTQGPLGRYARAGDHRLHQLKFDNAPEALQLWDFLLSETRRLYDARHAGTRLIATMKDLGTVPILAYALPDTLAFYPDGTWWIPCIMSHSTRDLAIADSLGIDESFCPVRAMLGAFTTWQHFPPPDLRICSVGATCDDFSAIAQCLAARGQEIVWWEIPHRRRPDPGERSVDLPGGLTAPAAQVAFVAGELQRIAAVIETATGQALSQDRLADAIARANDIRAILRDLRSRVFAAQRAPLPALELLIAEMLAIHYCSDRTRTRDILHGLLELVRDRAAAGTGLLSPDAVRIFWVNPVADLRAMNLLEECGGRLCGTDFMFGHALDEIPADIPPYQALARMALADPMVGGTADRAARIIRDARAWGAQAVVISRIPGASHCALEGALLRDHIRRALPLPIVEIEIPTLCDALIPALRTRLEALVEAVQRGAPP